MYFKQKKYFLLNKKEKVDVSTFDKAKQYKAFNKLFNDFIKYHHKKLLSKNNLQPFLEGTRELQDLKLSYRFENKFRNFLNIFDEMLKKDYSEKYYFKNFKSKFKRSNWYEFKKHIIKLTNKLLNNGYFEWVNHLGKLPIKNNIQKVYDHNDIKFITDKFIEETQSGYDFEMTNFWLHIRNNKVNTKLNKISAKTIKKILVKEMGLVFKANKKYTEKHPKRHYIAEPGIIQMDLKIIGQKDTSMKKNLVIFNMIETRSRLTFTEVLTSSSAECVLSALKAGKQFYEMFGIKINAIQTDNAMMFKETNFVNSNKYCAYLKENNIIRRLIPLGVPECNGCIERFHLTIDKRCQSLLSKVQTIDQAKEIISKFSNYYNFERYHYYSELEKANIPYANRYMTPQDAIKLLYNY